MNPKTAMPPMTFTRACPDGISPTVQTRLQHLFRNSLRAGRIHPLYQPMLKYRLARTTSEPR